MKFTQILIVLFFGLACFAQNNKAHEKTFDSMYLELQNLSKSGQIDNAVTKALKIKEFTSANLNESDYHNNKILFMLSLLYRFKKDYKNEFKTNIELNKLRSIQLKKESDSYKSSFEQFLKFYNNTPKKSKIPGELRFINQKLRKHLTRVLDSRFTEEKSTFLMSNVIPYNDLFQSFAYNTNYRYKHINNDLLDNTLLIKSSLLNSSRNILRTLEASNDLLVKEKIENYRHEKSFVSFQEALSKKDRDEQFQFRKERLNGFEQELITLYQKLPKTKNQLYKSWKRIPLKANEIAIEFTRFRYYNKKWTDSTIYTAQIFKENSSVPLIIPLFEEQQLIDAVNSKTPSNIYAIRGSNATSNQQNSNNTLLYNLIIKPIEKHLKGSGRIYYSPDGLLHQVAFSALATEEKKLLVEEFDMQRVSSSEVIKRNPSEPKYKTAVLYGGIDYDYKSKADASSSKKSIDYLKLDTFKSSKSNKNRSDSWTFLEGTLSEINALETIFTKASVPSFVYTDSKATETTLKSMSGDSPNVIHIATHGFFFEDIQTGTVKNQYTISEEPLLRSGLVFANGNYTWKNGSNPFEEEDGILTALEISNLNLSNTDIVILSACETGLGEIKGSEGVYGLQRAFKMAGVDIIIMSLWEVPDVETSEFMQQFYSSWINGKPVRTAFRDTQLKMANKYKGNPEKWAAFVLFE